MAGLEDRDARHRELFSNGLSRKKRHQLWPLPVESVNGGWGPLVCPILTFGVDANAVRNPQHSLDLFDFILVD